jgi:hypothetical protein
MLTQYIHTLARCLVPSKAKIACLALRTTIDTCERQFSEKMKHPVDVP